MHEANQNSPVAVLQHGPGSGGDPRRRLGFQGATVTDAINAGALAALGTPPQNAVKAANAGMDLILEATRDVSHGQAVVDALTSAFTGGTLDEPAHDAALRRIIELRRCLA